MILAQNWPKTAKSSSHCSLKDQKLGKHCSLEPYYNLIPAELICHVLFYARAYLRKENSWSTGIIFTIFKRRQIAYCEKHRDLGKVINTWNDDQFNLTQKIQHTFQCITSTKCNGWKISMFILQNSLRTANPENFSSIGQILLKISFLNSKTNSFWETSFKLMATEIFKIKLHYPYIQILWKIPFFLKIPP